MHGILLPYKYFIIFILSSFVILSSIITLSSFIILTSFVLSILSV